MKKFLLTFCALLTAVVLCACADDAAETLPSISFPTAPAVTAPKPEPVTTEAATEATAETATQAATEPALPEDASAIEENDPWDWSGVYYYDDGMEGELLILEGMQDAALQGQYVYAFASGGYGIREFEPSLYSEDPFAVREQFQTGYVYYYLERDHVYADYPDGWYPDRQYVYVCEVGGLLEHFSYHSVFGKQTIPPFYGVWILASKDRDDAVDAVNALPEELFPDAGVFETTNWSNLNPEHWYVASAGRPETEEQAEALLEAVFSQGHSDAYIKYTGDYIGS